MPRIIIVGAGGSGKNHLEKKYTDKYFNSNVSYTTRPPRNGEINGRDYFFISKEEFLSMIENDDFQEYDEFNGWYYGTGRITWDSSDGVFIKTPRGVKQITESDRRHCLIIYLDIDEDVRRKRLSERQDADSVERRLIADRNDFKDFNIYDIRITNCDF